MNIKTDAVTHRQCGCGVDELEHLESSFVFHVPLLNIIYLALPIKYYYFSLPNVHGI